MPVTGLSARSRSLRGRASLALVLLVSLSPMALYLAKGALEAPLWLDEVAYHYWESDLDARAQEIGRPPSPWIRLVSNYCFGDLQRGVQFIASFAGISILKQPEFLLRFTSLVSFIGAVIVMAFGLPGCGRPRPLQGIGAAVFGSSPMLLDFGVEGRVYMLACLLVVLLLSTLESALENPSSSRLAAIALLSLLVAQTHQWTICLFLALAAALFLPPFRPKVQGLTRLASATLVPGMLSLGAQWLYLTLSDPGLPRFRLFDRLPWDRSLLALFEKPFTNALFTPPYSSHFEEWLPRLASLLYAVAIALAISTSRRRRLPLSLPAGLIALLLSAAVASLFGFIVPGRHQSFLHAAVILGLSRVLPESAGESAWSSQARSPMCGYAFKNPVAITMALLVAMNLLYLHSAARNVLLKSNGRTVAAAFSYLADEGDVLVVQNPVRWGFPDPIYTFPIDFYLNYLHPERPARPVFELPQLANVAGRRVLSPFYFWGGPALLEESISTPLASWRLFLEEAGSGRVWIVNPVPADGNEAAIMTSFDRLLRESGFTQEGQTVHFADNMPSTFRVFKRLPPVTNPRNL